MSRVVTQVFMVVLALVVAVASAGTVLCEMNCVAGNTGASATGMHDGSMKVAISHCDGERTESMQLDIPAPHGSSGGNTKHSGAHSHLRIVATATAEVRILPEITFSDFAITPANLAAPIFASADQNFWNNNSSPPMKSPPVFSASVLRI